MKKLLICAALVAAFSPGMVLKPAYGLRCSGRIIDSGNTKAEVREACGEPFCTRRPDTVFVNKGGIYWPMAADEEWIYNFGSGQFVQFIRFYQGKVVFIQSGGYGWTGERECKDIEFPDH
jgi:Protein of unknown function (DUF2845)